MRSNFPVDNHGKWPWLGFSGGASDFQKQAAHKHEQSLQCYYYATLQSSPEEPERVPRAGDCTDRVQPLWGAASAAVGSLAPASAFLKCSWSMACL